LDAEVIVVGSASIAMIGVGCARRGLILFFVLTYFFIICSGYFYVAVRRRRRRRHRVVHVFTLSAFFHRTTIVTAQQLPCLVGFIVSA